MNHSAFMDWLYDTFKATGPLNARMIAGPQRRYFFSIWRPHQGTPKEIIFPLKLVERNDVLRQAVVDELLAKYGLP